MSDVNVRELSQKIWARPNVFLPHQMNRALTCPPDFSVSDWNGVSFIHRETDDEQIYFVASSQRTERQLTCRFRVEGEPELWEPDTGARRKIADWRDCGDGTTEVVLNVEPAGSVFVVFRRHPGDDLLPPRPALDTAMTLAEPWQVSFGEEGAMRVFQTLEPWNESQDESIRYFSGEAVYRTEFEWSGGSASALDLGQVHELAVVTLNGVELGTAWKPPYRVDLSGALKRGRNQLEVRVANLWVNRLIGEARKPDPLPRWEKVMGEFGLAHVVKAIPEDVVNGTRKSLFSVTTFWKANDPLRPSGLLGPVSIMKRGEAK